MLRLLPPVLLAAAFSIVPAVAEACSCGVHSLCTRYARAAAVFAAEVVAPPTELADRKVARVKVLRSYKGDAPSGGIVTLLTLPGSAASCSIDLEPGQRYVFFSGGSGGTYGTSLCSGNIQLERGAPLPDLPPQPGSVRGDLFRWDDATRRTRTPIAGARVWVDTPSGAIASRTDAHGRFQLSGVPPGRRHVRFDAGPDGEADAMVDLASTQDCADVFATPRPPGGLAGTVTGVDGKPVTTGSKEVGSVDASGGRWTVRVVRGHRYTVRGEVGVEERVPAGHFLQASRPTPAVVVDPDAPPARLVLRSELKTCGGPGGGVPTRW